MNAALSLELAVILALAEGTFFGCFAIPALVMAGRVVDRHLLPSAIAPARCPRASGRSSAARPAG